MWRRFRAFDLWFLVSVGVVPWIALGLWRGDLPVPALLFPAAGVVLATGALFVLPFSESSWQRSQGPGRASIVEAGTPAYSLAVLLSSFSALLGWFSVLYYALGERSSHCFNEQVGKIDALYFSATTFSTTGFGDLHAVSERCRLVVAAQLILSVFLVAIVFVMVLRRVTE